MGKFYTMALKKKSQMYAGKKIYIYIKKTLPRSCEHGQSGFLHAVTHGEQQADILTARRA